MQESLFYRLLGITCHNSAFLTISPFVNSVNSFPYFFRNSSAMHKSNKNGLASLLATRQFCWICIWRSAISENLRCIAAYRWWNHQFELIWLRKKSLRLLQDADPPFHLLFIHTMTFTVASPMAAAFFRTAAPWRTPDTFCTALFRFYNISHCHSHCQKQNSCHQ